MFRARILLCLALLISFACIGMAQVRYFSISGQDFVANKSVAPHPPIDNAEDGGTFPSEANANPPKPVAVSTMNRLAPQGG